jgi:large exoprotein involved in heme utilization and adhesion
VFLDNAGIYSQANKHSSGNAGAVNLTVAAVLEVLNGGKVSTSTWGGGHAGNVFITAKAAQFNGGGIIEPITTIYSDAYSTSTGNAGTVTLNIDGPLEVRNGAAISTNAWAIGDAGTVTVHAGDLLLDGTNSLISSRALESATGNVGNINVIADELTINNGAQISIAALQTVADQTLSLDRRIQINAASLALNASTITAQSTGNVPAAAIQINAADLRLNTASRITTESLAANAGAITIDSDILWLRDSQITTSAEGQNGDGGDITLTPHNLILQSGFIQANTAASGARGGDIRINSDTLIASQRLLAVGGNERQTFIAGDGRNIIQAAAPGGEQGNINILALNLDISASVVPPSASLGDPNDLFADICQTLNGSLASSLIDRGNGGVPADPSAPVAVSLGGIRLDRILNHTTE